MFSCLLHVITLLKYMAHTLLHARGGAGGGAGGAAAPPIFWDLFYKLPPGGQSLSSAGPTNNLQPATSLLMVI